MTFPNEKTPAAASKTAAAPADAAAVHSKTGADAPAACAGCVHDDPHADRTSTPCTTATRRLADVSRTFNQWLTYGQAAALIAIAVAAIGGIGQAGWEMIAARAISLGDLLMLFLYVEILSMVKGAALGTREIPIHTPIALAIVAVARYIVVDVEHISPNYMLFTSSSILVLVLALWLVRKAPNNDNP